MSLVKARRTILEIRSDKFVDWYLNKMWLCLDKKTDKSVTGYEKIRAGGCFGLEHLSLSPEDILKGVPKVKCRLKVEKRNKRCVSFQKYRRPTFNVTL